MRHAGWMTVAAVLLASSVACANGPGDGTRIEGAITVIDAEAQELVVADTTVQITEQTLIKKNGRVITLPDLAVGMTVAACGTLEGEVLIANRVTVRPCLVASVDTAAATLSIVTLTKGVHLVPLSAEEQDGLVFMREEEKLAHDVYVTLYAQWNVAIFANIAAAEQTHMDSILTLLVRYGVADPVAGMGVGEFATEHFQILYAELVALGSESLLDGLAVGATIEDMDIVDLLDRLGGVTHQDLSRVYQNLERASENHLRAFVGQLANGGVVYEPQYLDPQLYQEIIGG